MSVSPDFHTLSALRHSRYRDMEPFHPNQSMKPMAPKAMDRTYTMEPTPPTAYLQSR